MDLSIILDFFKTYGWQLGLLSLSGIVILGFLKWFGCFKKVKDSYKKYLYFSLSVIFSIIACTIYILITKSFNWLNYALLCLAIVGLTLVVYGIYENTGLRALWKKLVLDNIAKLFKLLVSAIVKGSLSKEKVKDIALKVGSEMLNEWAAEAKVLEDKKAEEEKAAEEQKNSNTNEPVA